jgi:hypothetical protein
MTRKTLWEFAAEHAPAPMTSWREAYGLVDLRRLNGDEDQPLDPLDPGNVMAQAEADVEAILAPLFASGRYAVEGRRSGAVERERLHPDTMNPLWFRLALNNCGVVELDQDGCIVNAWESCIVVGLAPVELDAAAITEVPKATPRKIKGRVLSQTARCRTDLLLAFPPEGIVDVSYTKAVRRIEEVTGRSYSTHVLRTALGKKKP